MTKPREVNRFYQKSAEDKELASALNRAAAHPKYYALYKSTGDDPEWFEWDYLLDGASSGSKWCKDWQPCKVVRIDTVDISQVDPEHVGKGKAVPGVEAIWPKTNYR